MAPTRGNQLEQVAWIGKLLEIKDSLPTPRIMRAVCVYVWKGWSEGAVLPTLSSTESHPTASLKEMSFAHSSNTNRD